MAYYSFYKIFKDIIKTIFGKRVFRILLIVLIIILIGTKVFAVDVNTDYNNITINVPDNYFDYKFVILYTYNSNNGNKLSIYINNNEFSISNLVYDTDFRYYKRTFNPATGYLKDYSVSNINDNNINHYIQGQSTIGTSTTSAFYASNISSDTIKFVVSNFDVSIGGTVYPANASIIKYPEIANSIQDLQTLNFDVISINAWDWSNKDIDVLFYDRNVKDTSTTEGLYPKRVITLNKNTSYYQSGLTANPDKNAIYWIPIDEIGLNLYVGGTYEIRLAERVPLDPPEYGADYYYNYLGDPVNFTISSDVSQDRINAINKEIEDTTNKKYHDETINKMDTINNNINNLNNNINNVNDALTNTTPDSSVSSDIDNSLNFDNQNEQLNNLNNGFFTRLTTILSNLLGYNLSEDTSVSIPFPNSDKHLILHSKDIYDNVTGAIRVIINAFWVYIFSFYLWKFINKIYIAVSTGNILNSFSSSGEAITNDML